MDERLRGRTPYLQGIFYGVRCFLYHSLNADNLDVAGATMAPEVPEKEFQSDLSNAGTRTASASRFSLCILTYVAKKMT